MTEIDTRSKFKMAAAAILKTCISPLFGSCLIDAKLNSTQ